MLTLSGPDFKGFVGPRHVSSLGPFTDSRSIVGTSVLSIIRANGRGVDAQIIRSLFFIHRPFL
jgi:hypothetical protein